MNVFVLVLHSGEYYMFESDSGEEDESFQEEQKPRRQTAFQVTRVALNLYSVICLVRQLLQGYVCKVYVYKMFPTAGVPGLGHQCKRSPERPSAETERAESRSKETTNRSGFRLNADI